MAFQSFQNFEWLHLQPSWFKPVPPPPDTELDYKTAIRTARFERWAPLWKLLLLDYEDYQIGALIGLREEYEGGFGRRG